MLREKVLIEGTEVELEFYSSGTRRIAIKFPNGELSKEIDSSKNLENQIENFIKTSKEKNNQFQSLIKKLISREN